MTTRTLEDRIKQRNDKYTSAIYVSSYHHVRAELDRLARQVREKALTEPVEWVPENSIYPTKLTNSLVKVPVVRLAQVHGALAEKDGRIKELEKTRLALEGLTPGGSEYVNDPERCVAWVQDIKSKYHEAMLEGVRLRRELAAATQELARVKNEIGILRHEGRPSFSCEVCFSDRWIPCGEHDLGALPAPSAGGQRWVRCEVCQLKQAYDDLIAEAVWAMKLVEATTCVACEHERAQAFLASVAAWRGRQEGT